MSTKSVSRMLIMSRLWTRVFTITAAALADKLTVSGEIIHWRWTGFAEWKSLGCLCGNIHRREWSQAVLRYECIRVNSESGVLKPLSVDAGFRNKWSTNLICFVFMDEVEGCAMTSNAWKITNTSVGVFVRGCFRGCLSSCFINHLPSHTFTSTVCQAKI